ncbi:stimulus-sensing domain-containing protein [Roseospirillum parvum]|uniref:histidine kinase n=1 Tax=Roseospirillum parvum TaxID=83401 RepID=A0A1G7WH01_9PROT|nr:stimulus-sensing domain-containing protein [Roseospirillum parvum]SDG71295.1 two-component system, OmpR family, sensor histidine kinase ChvG [Roseospirillum parvum]
MRADPAFRPISSRRRRVIWRRRWRRLPGSPLTRRILAVNLLAPLLLVGGLLYLDHYQETLVETRLSGLHTQAALIAAAIGESAVTTHPGPIPLIGAGVLRHELAVEESRMMIRRLADLIGLRIRLFDPNGLLVADSQMLRGPGGLVQVRDLPPPDQDLLTRLWRWLHDRLLATTVLSGPYPPYVERARQTSVDYDEVAIALDVGEPAHAIRATEEGPRILSYAVPVQFYKQVVGAVMVSESSAGLDAEVFQVRTTILKVFLAVLAVTVLVSVYLARTIARPLRLLAARAERIRHAEGGGGGRGVEIPDFTRRGDEIGELSGVLRQMTAALWARMDAIERFAADVAHEIKNPLTSLKSAVETVARVRDPEQQKRLMGIIEDDVKRLDRLISDISDASRLDAELSRAETAPVKVAEMLGTLAAIHRDTAESVALDLALPEGGDPLPVAAVEGRLTQVLRNLLSNARSFSPPGGRIRLAAWRDNGRVLVSVEDDGPGIPPGKEEAIFDRFYSDRPAGEKFGTHSGLGLAISRQIVEAAGGTLTAGNRQTPDGTVAGARFLVDLPALGEG